MSDTPRTDKLLDEIKDEEAIERGYRLYEFCRTLESDLASSEKERIKYRERAWSSEAQLDIRYGLRREINAELGITDETGDDALRKGLQAIRELKKKAGIL